MAARLTIAIPTYNRADLLKRALESALAQTSEEIEILVSDNGSTDTTPEVLANYNDPRLRKVRHDATFTRARHGTWLFNNISTELVLALSDDDWLEAEFSTEVLKLYNEHPEISFAYTGCIEHYDDAELPALVGPRLESSLNFFTECFAGKRHISWCACVCRVRDILEIGPQPEKRIMGDMFFWTKIAFKGPVGCVSKPLAHYSVLRPDGDNQSKTVPIWAWGKDSETVCKEVLKGAKKFGASEDYLAKLKHSMQQYVLGSVANQFISARLYGARTPVLFFLAMPYLLKRGWTSDSFRTVVAGIFFLRPELRQEVHKTVRMLAGQRTAMPQTNPDEISLELN